MSFSSQSPEAHCSFPHSIVVAFLTLPSLCRPSKYFLSRPQPRQDAHQLVRLQRKILQLRRRRGRFRSPRIRRRRDARRRRRHGRFDAPRDRDGRAVVPPRIGVVGARRHAHRGLAVESAALDEVADEKRRGRRGARGEHDGKRRAGVRARWRGTGFQVREELGAVLRQVHQGV